MTAEVFTIKRGDNAKSIRYALIPASVVLTGAQVRFQMRTREGALLIDQPATIVTPTGTPTVQYDWQTNDTANAGEFEAEFKVTYANSKVETFPDNGFIHIVIGEDVR